MTATQLRDYILTQMSAEDALLKLLEGSLITYEKLKFDEQEKAIHPIILISMAAMDMGWNFAVEKEQENIRGLSVGTEEYLKALFPKTNPQTENK